MASSAFIIPQVATINTCSVDSHRTERLYYSTNKLILCHFTGLTTVESANIESIDRDSRTPERKVTYGLFLWASEDLVWGLEVSVGTSSWLCELWLDTTSSEVVRCWHWDQCKPWITSLNAGRNAEGYTYMSSWEPANQTSLTSPSLQPGPLLKCTGENWGRHSSSASACRMMQMWSRMVSGGCRRELAVTLHG